MNQSNPNLTQHPPRSPRVRLGGFVMLPRTLDKGRADLAGRLGEYHFGCPLDRGFLAFVGIEFEDFRAALASGRTDGKMLAWIHEHARHHRTPEEIAAWSEQQTRGEPHDDATRAFFAETKQNVAPHRTDIVAWYDLMDVDDFAIFGGRA